MARRSSARYEPSLDPRLCDSRGGDGLGVRLEKRSGCGASGEVSITETFKYLRYVVSCTTSKMVVEPHALERKHGDGSRIEADDLYESASYRHDERSQTETTFFESDIDSLNVSERRKRELRRMLRRQEGENQGEHYQSERRMRRDANRDEWKRRMVCVHASQLDLTRHQKERSIHLVRDVLDFSSFGSYNKEQCILGVINVVVREDGRFIEDEDQFRDVMKREGVTPKSMRNIRRLIRERL